MFYCHLSIVFQPRYSPADQINVDEHYSTLLIDNCVKKYTENKQLEKWPLNNNE